MRHRTPPRLTIPNQTLKRSCMALGYPAAKGLKQAASAAKTPYFLVPSSEDFNLIGKKRKTKKGMVSSKDDSASDGENSSGDVPESKKSCLFSEGEKVLAYHGPKIYEAKACLKTLIFSIFRIEISIPLFFFNFKYSQLLCGGLVVISVLVCESCSCDIVLFNLLMSNS